MATWGLPVWTSRCRPFSGLAAWEPSSYRLPDFSYSARTTPVGIPLEECRCGPWVAVFWAFWGTARTASALGGGDVAQGFPALTRLAARRCRFARLALESRAQVACRAIAGTPPVAGE